MPRVILRTVEPAKLLACQSVEKRCTRWKASAMMSVIIFSVTVMIPMKARCRRMAREPERHQQPERRHCRIPRDHGIGGGAAGDRVDQLAGIERRQHVGDGGEQEAAADDGDSDRLLFQCWAEKRSTLEKA